MPLFILLLYISLFSTTPQTDIRPLVGTSWKVQEVHQWHNLEKLYSGVVFQFTTAKEVQALDGAAKTTGSYSIKQNPLALEIVFTRMVNGTEYEAKDEFNLEYPSDKEILLKPFFRGGGESYIRLVKVR